MALVVGKSRTAKQSHFMSIEKGGREMDAIKQITSILTACGCAPTVEKRNGETVIKVNAPTAEKSEDTKK